MPVDFIAFEDYKKIGGVMNEDEFDRVRRAEWAQEQYKNAFSEIANLGLGLPYHSQVDIYTRISVVFPNEDPIWKLTETYLVLGRK